MGALQDGARLKAHRSCCVAHFFHSVAFSFSACRSNYRYLDLIVTDTAALSRQRAVNVPEASFTEFSVVKLLAHCCCCLLSLSEDCQSRWQLLSKVDTTITLRMRHFFRLCSSTVRPRSRGCAAAPRRSDRQERALTRWLVLQPGMEWSVAWHWARGCERLSGAGHLQSYATSEKCCTRDAAWCRSHLSVGRRTAGQGEVKGGARACEKQARRTVIGSELSFYTFMTAVNNEWKATAKKWSGASEALFGSQRDVRGPVDKKETGKLSPSVCWKQWKPVGQQNNFSIFLPQRCQRALLYCAAQLTRQKRRKIKIADVSNLSKFSVLNISAGH